MGCCGGNEAKVEKVKAALAGAPPVLAEDFARDPEALRAAVKRRYAAAARQVATGEPGCGCGCADPVSSDLYEDGETAGTPEAAVKASLGCGNPVALAELHEGEVVLDLGSGGGLDVLLSARRVGPTGKAYGLDMTEEMLELARANQRQAGVANVEFLHGQMEAVPLPDASVDVIISNCVVNLAADKDRVLREAFRVLRPGGRLAIADVVTQGEIPTALRRQVELWSGCLAGALDVEDYGRRLVGAGFHDVGIEITRVYDPTELGEEGIELVRRLGLDPAEVSGRFASGFVRAVKPVAAAATA